MLAETGYSGGEVQLEHLLRHLQQRGHENHLVLPPRARFAAVAADLGVPVATLDLRRPLSTGAVARLRSHVRRLGPDVLHFGCGRSLLWGGLATVGIGTPVKVTTRRIDYPIGRSLYRGGRYRRLVDHVVANCRSVERRVLDAGVPRSRVTLVHEGIDVAPWREARADRDAARERLGLPADALVVSCAATLRPRKGQRLLVDAFARLAAERAGAVLVLAGAGSDLEMLRERAAQTGLGDRIRVPGPVSPVRDLYAASDVFTMPSFHEGLSNACLEAAAAGLPQVVTSVGGLPEIVEDGRHGFVVEPGDVASLADRLARLADDAALRARFGAAAQAHVTRTFTAARMAGGMESLFVRLVEERRAVAGAEVRS